MSRTASDAPITTTVSALSDQRLVQQLKELTAVEHQLEVVVIDHLRELERRRLYLSWGFSSLFDYATHELGYSEAAAWRRIKAMRLCGEVEGARERMRDGSLTLNSAALLQNAFDRQERKRKQPGGGRGAPAGARSAVAPDGSAPGPGAPPREPSVAAQAGKPAEEPPASPVLDSSARQALVEEAAGKSARQVERLLAGVDPELTVPADRIRPLGAGRWELKAVIDDDCRRGLEQLKGLLSHVDPHMTLGQLVGRVVREAVERHDPARPPRGRRTGTRAAGVAAETLALKEASEPDTATARRNAARAGGGETSAPKDAPEPDTATARRNAARAGGGETSAPKDAPEPDAATAHRNAARAGGGETSAPKDAPEPDAATARRNAARAGGGETSAPKDAPEPDAAAARRNAARAGGGETSAPKDAPGPDTPGHHNAAPAGVATAPAKRHAECAHRRATAAKAAWPSDPAFGVKGPAGPDFVAAPARTASMPAGVTTSPTKAPADSGHGRAPAKRPAGDACTGASAPKAECARQRHGAPPLSQVRGRAILVAVKRQVWERDRGCCTYVDRGSGRRCGSRYLVQIDHVVPYALGGSAEPDNLRLLCAAHHRHRHEYQAAACR